MSRRQLVKRPVIVRQKAGPPAVGRLRPCCRSRSDRSARRDRRERVSVDEPAEEIRIVDEVTSIFACLPACYPFCEVDSPEVLATRETNVEMIIILIFLK